MQLRRRYSVFCLPLPLLIAVLRGTIDLTNEVDAARREVAEWEKRLVEIRNSANASEEEIQVAQAARHAAQERLDSAYEAFVAFTDGQPMRNASVDEEDAVLSDVDDESSEEGEEVVEVEVGRIDEIVGESDDDSDESYHP